jgi:hypothetical protein
MSYEENRALMEAKLDEIVNGFFNERPNQKLMENLS